MQDKIYLDEHDKSAREAYKKAEDSKNAAKTILNACSGLLSNLPASSSIDQLARVINSAHKDIDNANKVQSMVRFRIALRTYIKDNKQVCPRCNVQVKDRDIFYCKNCGQRIITMF